MRYPLALLLLLPTLVSPAAAQTARPDPASTLNPTIENDLFGGTDK